MKNLRNLLIAFLFSTGFISCNHGISNAMLEINTADSATIIYYERPPDNRFFKVVKGKTITDLKSVVKDVNASAIKSKATCESIGKIYFYKGTEQVYIVYFSDDTCRRFSFIKNGERYESDMSNVSFDLLDKLKSSATEPNAK